MKLNMWVHRRRQKWLVAVMLAALIGNVADVVAAGQVGDPATIENTGENHVYQDLEDILERREIIYDESDFIWSATTWDDFEAKARELAEQSLRLVDVDVLVSDDEIHYVGVWQLGSGNFALWTCPTLDCFNSIRQELIVRGLHLIDAEVYRYQGKLRYLGLFREDLSDDFQQMDKEWDGAYF